MRRMSDVHLLTHRDCLDGTGAIVHFLRAGGDPSNIHLVGAGDASVDLAVTPLLEEGREVHVVDVCPSERILGLLVDAGGLVCDHHASTIDRMRRNAAMNCVSNQLNCGSEIYRLWLEGGLLVGPMTPAQDEICRAIEAYDLYRTERPIFWRGEWLADLSAAGLHLGQIDFAREIAEDAHYVLNSGNHAIAVQTVRGMRDRYVREAVSACRRFFCWIEPQNPHPWGVEAAVAISPFWWRNAVAHALLGLDGVELAIVIDPNSNAASVRTHGERVDCAAWAERFYGGGGHRKAAGFAIDGQEMLRRFFE